MIFFFFIWAESDIFERNWNEHRYIGIDPVLDSE